jgi:glyoxylase-like metal-dependent hydrolase (beta-lactamase superfamily II)
MNRAVAAALAGASLLASGAASAQANFANVQIKPVDLGHNTWLLLSSDGRAGGTPLPNVTVAVGADGVIVVDTAYAPMHDKIKAAIRSITDKPVKVVINTHYHGDHTGGDQAFWLEGAAVVAQDNVSKREAEGVVDALTGRKSAIVPAGGRPTQTYAERYVVRLGGRTARLTHLHNAHTDGDTAVYFPDANVLCTGDLFSARFPNVDVGAGGNFDGIIKAMDFLIAHTNDKTKVVSGHFALTDRAGLKAYRARMIEARSRVARLVKDGKTEDEAVAAKPLADMQAAADADDAFTATRVRQIYLSLKPKA